jgi:hypothetical protein
MPAIENDDDNNKAEALAALPDDIDALKALVLEHQARLAIRDTEIEHLKLLIAKLKRMQFGRSSEKLNKQVEQLELRLEELQSAEAQIAAARTPERREKMQPVRRPLPEHLPRKEVVHQPSCSCPDCGQEMRQIGEDVSEMLDYVPEHFRVIRHVRPKLACPRCEKIVQLDAPSRPIDRGMARRSHNASSRFPHVCRSGACFPLR